MIELQLQALNGSNQHIAYGEWARFLGNNFEEAEFVPLNYWKDMAPLDFITARPEGVMLQCGIMLIPRKLIELGGLWDERLILFNDTEFFTRLLLKSGGVKFSKGARLYYRSAQSNSLSVGRTRKYFESTFLATNLIADQLLDVEDSFRTRNLISNMFMNRYAQFYPQFPDLGKKHEEKINYYGSCTAEPGGGIVFKMVKSVAGWKAAKRVQYFFYKIGYSRLLDKNSKKIISHKADN
jgi:hypothetical protein